MIYDVGYELLLSDEQPMNKDLKIVNSILAISVTSAVLLFTLYTYFSLTRAKNVMNTGGTALSSKLRVSAGSSAEQQQNLSKCLSIYELMMANIKAGIGFRYKAKPVLSLVAAYAYPNYSAVTIEADGWFGDDVYCRYFDKNQTEIKPSVKSVVYPEFVVHCCNQSYAQYMSVTEGENQEVIQLVPVLDRIRDDPKYNLSLCLSPIYGEESKWMLLVEVIEHYKLEGVEHFYVYIKDIDYYSRKLIDSYVESGEVETICFSDKQNRTGMHWQLAGIKDCLHRSRHHSRYSIFADLDERIMTTSSNISLAEYVSKTFMEIPNLALICFRTRVVLRTRKPPEIYEGERTLHEHLPTLVFHNTSAIASILFKCVLDSRRVLDMTVHVSIANFPGYVGYRAPAQQAIVVHYRNASDDWRSNILPRMLRFGAFEMMDYPDHLMRRLYPNVKQRLDRVYGNNKHQKRLR